MQIHRTEPLSTPLPPIRATCCYLFILFLAGGEEGVLDDLMEALSSGRAFRDPSRPERKRQPRKGNMSLVLYPN